MKGRPSAVRHTLVDGRFPPINFKIIPEQNLTQKNVDELVCGANKNFGLDVAYTSTGKLSAITISSSDLAIIIAPKKGRPAYMHASPALKHLERELLTHPTRKVYAFSAEKAAIFLYSTLGLRVSRCIDLLSLDAKGRDSVLRCIKAIFDLNGSHPDFEPQYDTINKAYSSDVWETGGDRENDRPHVLVEKAWLAGFLGGLEGLREEIAKIPVINTIGRSDTVDICCLPSLSFRTLNSFLCDRNLLYCLSPFTLQCLCLE